MPEFEQVLRNPLYKTPEIALINAGKCSVALGDRRRTPTNIFRRALAASPGNPPAAYNLALLAYRESRVGEARAWMRPVMQQAAPPPEALYLGMCIERKQGDREAERVVRVAAAQPLARFAGGQGDRRRSVRVTETIDVRERRERAREPRDPARRARRCARRARRRDCRSTPSRSN